MEEYDTKYEAIRRAIEIYEEAIEYYKKNLLKRTEFNTLITPSLISSFRKRVNELKEQL